MISTQRIFLTGVILFCATVGLLLAATTAVWLFLPTWLESSFIPRMAAKAGFTDFQLQVRAIHLDGIDLADLVIGPLEPPDLQVHSIIIDYNPETLLSEKKLTQIRINGIELHGEFKRGKFTIPVLNRKNNSAPPSPVILPKEFPIKKCTVRDAVFICELASATLRIPFELDLYFPDPPSRQIRYTFCLFIREQRLSGTGTLDAEDWGAAMGFNAAAVDLTRFNDLFISDLGWPTSGSAEFNGSVRGVLRPFRVLEAKADITLKAFAMEYRSWRLENQNTSSNDDIRLHIEKRPEPSGAFDISANAAALSTPFPVKIELSDINARLHPDGFRGSGNIGVRLTSGSANLPDIHSQDATFLFCGFEAALSKDHLWEAKFAPSAAPANTHTLPLHYGAVSLESPPPVFYLSAQGNLLDGTGQASGTLTLTNTKATLKDATLDAAETELQTTAAWTRKLQKGAFKLNIRQADAGQTQASLGLPRTFIQGTWRKSFGENLQVSGKLQFEGGKASLPALKTKLLGLNGQIPFQWPHVRPQPPRGFLKISEIHRDGLKLGNLALNLYQRNGAFEFEGTHENLLLPQLSTSLSGHATFETFHAPRINAHIATTYPDTAAGIRLNKIIPVGSDMICRGNLGLTGDILWDPTGLKGAIRSYVKAGGLLSEAKKIDVEGIRLELDFPSLPGLHSAPAQKLYFSKASVGALTGTDGRIDFQVESPQSLLIEKTRFTWCGGQVTMEATRLRPGKNDYDIVLYCDRLKLTEVLEQFGAAEAEGGGTLTGRIPLKIENGKLRFQDGFLFSAPGEGGNLHITGAEALTAGIPPNTPQYTQLELAREALKDYEYTWAKLNLTTDGEELLLRLQLDGKPGNPLPFVYKKDFGGFVKIEGAGEASIFEGIRLDVNFRLPIDKLLQYKDLFNQIK